MTNMVGNDWFDSTPPLLLDLPWLRVEQDGHVYYPAIIRLRHRLSRSFRPEAGEEHRHRVYHFIFCLEGANYFIVDGREYPFSRGDFFMINPGQSHLLNPLSPEYVRFYALTFSFLGSGGEELDLPWGSVLLRQFGVTSPVEKGRLAEDRLPRAEEELTRWLDSLIAFDRDLSPVGLGFMDFLRRFYLNPPGREEGALLTPVDRAVRFIRDNYAQSLDLDELARASRLSKGHFVRLFRERFGRTPMAYLSDYRLDRAAYLLVHTDLTASEAAFQCGFESAGYFGKVFKKSRGVTPGEYRRGFRD